MRRGRTLIHNTGKQKGEIITNTKKIQEITRDYFKNLYSNKLENLEKNGQISRYI
jgi:hypothetical protein